MHRILLTVILASSVVFASEEGKELHDESCVACHVSQHDDAFYERNDRKMENLSMLRGQVSMCTQAFSVGWFPEEEQAVIDYLNDSYYKFEK